ncbi:Galactose-3-O-sulfotransferase 3 [Holothuria leucospilota]|uniref:Galactose-3-O-sulfotransferase 3 n=1 Tax=Holothuria leucospilota TaxID=206669 RepID=A0A9Q1C2R6_HOLLE|nr:Galactose-3-O-sulfotransferase 3 [Holothuria leucospilota]
MESYMNPGAKFITILRYPVYQFVSAFLFFHIDKNIAGNTTDEKLLNYIQEDKWKKSNYGRNSQSYDLGLSKKYFDDVSITRKLIERLSKELHLVMISDYFEESLVLLKHELRWSFEDVSFIFHNKGKREKPKLSVELVNAIKKFNNADVMLYDYFNKTFWDKIKEKGSSFWEDLKEFKRVQNQTVFRCSNISTLSGGSKDGGLLRDTCETFSAKKLFKLLFKRQERKC